MRFQAVPQLVCEVCRTAGSTRGAPRGDNPSRPAILRLFYAEGDRREPPDRPTDVIESGERVITTILKTYLEPNLSPEEIQSAASTHNDHLQEFSNACRRELESLGKKI